MIKLIGEIVPLVDEEHVRANNEHDNYFNSPNEALGVILEEIEEACDEAVEVGKAFDNYKKAVYSDDTEQQDVFAADIYSAAIRAAAEFIQVAAMAQKSIESNDQIKVEVEYE